MPNERLRHHRLQLAGPSMASPSGSMPWPQPSAGSAWVQRHDGRPMERGERQPRGIYRGLLAILYDTTTEDWACTAGHIRKGS